MSTLTASTLAAQRLTTLQLFENLLQQANAANKMEGLILCKVCLGETPRYNKECHLCHNELGDRCWQCNYLGRPNSKFCFRCNAKLHGIDMPTPDSILPIPPYRPSASQQHLQYSSQKQTNTNCSNNKYKLDNEHIHCEHGIPSASSVPGSPRGIVDSEPAIHSIRSIIENLNTKSAATTSPPSSTPPRDAKSRFSMIQSKRSITPTSPPSPSTSVPAIAASASPSPSVSPSTSSSSNDKPIITISLKQERSVSTSAAENGHGRASNRNDSYLSINLLDQLLADTSGLSNRTSSNNHNNVNVQQKELYESLEIHSNSNALTTITPLSTLSGSCISNSTSISSPCLMSTPNNLTTESSSNVTSPTELYLSPRQRASTTSVVNITIGSQVTVAQHPTSTTTPPVAANGGSNGNSANNTVKRRSFGGSGSSIFNEIIDAFPAPPETMILSPTNSNNGKNGASSSSVLSPKSPMSTVPSPKSTSTTLASDQRTFLIKEIISTELDYINDLETIIQVFYRPLRDDLKLISTEECASVFSNIEQLFEVNKELYTKMVSSSSTIGEVFCLMSDSLDVYSVYCNYHQKSLESLSILTKLPQIENFISDIISKPELRGMSLHSFLIKPVQRICKYPLLLRELLKATPSDHVDYGQLISAVAKIEQIVNIINKEKMENETWQRTMQIIQSLKGAENLHLSKRHLLNEGSMQMVEGFNENSEKKSSLKYKKGFFFLFNDLFIFAKQKGSVYRLVTSIPLDTVLVHSSVSIDKHFFTMVEIGVGGKRWTFYPPSKAQNQVLVISIQKLIEKCWEGRFDPKPILPLPNGAQHVAPHSPSMQKKKINRLVKSLVNMKTL